jgi:hypothetical protein
MNTVTFSQTLVIKLADEKFASVTKETGNSSEHMQTTETQCLGNEDILDALKENTMMALLLVTAAAAVSVQCGDSVHAARTFALSISYT